MNGRIIVFPRKNRRNEQDCFLKIFFAKSYCNLFTRILEHLIMFIIKEQVCVFCVTCVQCSITGIGVVDVFDDFFHIILELFCY